MSDVTDQWTTSINGFKAQKLNVWQLGICLSQPPEETLSSQFVKRDS